MPNYPATKPSYDDVWYEPKHAYKYDRVFDNDREYDDRLPKHRKEV